MRLTTTTHVSLDGVMQGLGGSGEDRRGGFERGGSTTPRGVTIQTQRVTGGRPAYARS